MEDMKKEINEATTINEIFNIANKYYDLDIKLGYVTGKIVKVALTKNLEKLVAAANINKRDYAETE